MQITRQTEYGIIILMELAKEQKGKYLQSEVISKRQDLPLKFLTKTVQILSRAGFVETRKGSQGGIRLAVEPDSITIADVLKAVEGKVAINPCLKENYYCNNQPHCRVRGILHRAQEAMLAELSKETIAELINGNSVIEEIS